MTTDHTAAPRTTDTAPAGAAADPRRWRLLVFVASSSCTRASRCTARVRPCSWSRASVWSPGT
ncbi:hypothetical protein ABT086_42445, partial [Streptomyces mirabilis]